jgi:hypothetical protein
MRKFLIMLVMCLLSETSTFAEWLNPNVSLFEVGIGYRRGKFNWGIHGDAKIGSGADACSAEMVSDLDWKKLNIFQLEARGAYLINELFYVRGSVGYGWIVNGKNRDSDFCHLHPKTHHLCSVGSSEEFARSKARTSGRIRDVSFGVGYQFNIRLCGCNPDYIALNPLIGYSWHVQKLRDRYLHQVIPVSESVPGLDSSFHARWKGPWVGLDFNYRSWGFWGVHASYEYHWASYSAHGDWNMRPDLPEGFSQRARTAQGQIVKVGMRGPFCRHWLVGITIGWERWQTKGGQNKALRLLKKESRSIFVSSQEIDIEQQCYIHQPVRGVLWNSLQATLDIGMFF